MARAVSSSLIRNRTVLIFIWITSAMIIVSTLFVKQHVVLDAVSGIIYAEVLYRVVCTFGGVVWNFVKKQFLLVNLKKKLEA
jgi:membrane-associated phospholipid phosphatase